MISAAAATIFIFAQSIILIAPFTSDCTASGMAADARPPEAAALADASVDAASVGLMVASAASVAMTPASAATETLTPFRMRWARSFSRPRTRRFATASRLTPSSPAASSWVLPSRSQSTTASRNLTGSESNASSRSGRTPSATPFRSSRPPAITAMEPASRSLTALTARARSASRAVLRAT